MKLGIKDRSHRLSRISRISRASRIHRISIKYLKPSLVTIEIDSGSGFCFGVTTAIRKAEEELAKSGHLYCLGDIVHNSNEVERLVSSGLETITHERLGELHGATVLLRAHGEPPSTYHTAQQNGINIIDATCPVVLQLQKRIHRSYNTPTDDGQRPQIVIYGKRGHAEVNGLVGQTEGSAIVIESIDELEKVDYTRPTYLYSQTTKSLEGFKAVESAMRERMGEDVEFKSFDTICRSVANRIPQVRQFASQHELVLFVCGSKSSNGRILFQECLDANPNSHLISNESELDPSWLAGVQRVGICGATSTPRWLMNNVKEHIENLVTNSAQQ